VPEDAPLKFVLKAFVLAVLCAVGAAALPSRADSPQANTKQKQPEPSAQTRPKRGIAAPAGEKSAPQQAPSEGQKDLIEVMRPKKN